MRLGNGVYYKDEKTCEKECSIEISGKDDVYRIKLTRGNKKDVFAKLTRQDITLLGKQIWSLDSRVEWKESIDQWLLLSNFREKYKKEHGEYPVITG